MTTEVRKRLSLNDVGETGTHQAGILVPKEEQVLAFFPRLDAREKNPRMALVMREKADRTRWEFNLIYYNNKLFGGTRNEYRLTCMTQYMRSAGAKAGDELVLTKDGNDSFEVELQRGRGVPASDEPGVLVLSGGWKVVKY